MRLLRVLMLIVVLLSLAIALGLGNTRTNEWLAGALCIIVTAAFIILEITQPRRRQPLLWRRLIVAVLCGLFVSALTGRFGYVWILARVRWVLDVVADGGFGLWSTRIRYLETMGAIALALPGVLVAVLVYASLPGLPRDAETRCRKCGYILKGITEPRCPECGERI